MKRRISLLLVLVLFLGSFGSLALATRMGEAEGEFLRRQGILRGDENWDLRLDQPLTRKDMVVLLSRLMGKEREAKAFATGDLTFKDIPYDYYKPYIAWAVEEGYITGYSEERFGFSDYISLEEGLVLLLRVLNHKDLDYKSAYETALNLGLLRGLESLEPGHKLLRGEVARLIYKALGLPVKGEGAPLASSLCITLPGEEEGGKIQAFGNQFEIASVDDFLTGTFKNVEVVEGVGDGAIRLKKLDGGYPSHGEFVSPVIEVPDFDDFVMSWNSDTPGRTYVDYTTIEGLKYEVSRGYPVGVSVRYTNDPEDDRYPYVENAPGITPGHLIVVRGFTTIDGEEYVIVNDSFAPDDSTVRRLYRLEEFDKAWSNRAAYIIREKEEEAGTAPTMRLEGELRATDVEGEYRVFYGDKNIDVTNFSGVIAYTLDGDLTYRYFPREDKNSLTFTEEEINNPNLKVYVITDMGKVYICRYVDRDGKFGKL